MLRRACAGALHFANSPGDACTGRFRVTNVVASRVTGRIEGDFVVFLIGMRINKPWKPHKWIPVARAMPKMLKELEAAPARYGFLGHSGLGRIIVQYWRSFDDLERYARDRDALHWPAWGAFNRAMKDSRGDVGIWHETYRIRAGDYEAIYSGMPPFGLGQAGVQLAVTGANDAARQRLG
jgi:Domain of unknown function (DUF4188)